MAARCCRAAWTMAILPYQDDLRTDNISFTGCNVFPGATCGVFTSVTGTAPNRQFNIEWRAVHFADTTTSVNFEVVLHESLTSFDVIYGATSDSGLDETSGVQASSTGPATTFSCGTATLTSGLKVTYNCAGGGQSPTPTPTATGTPGGCTVMGSIDTSDPTQVDRLFRGVFRKPVQQPRHVRSMVMGFRGITIRTRSQTTLARVNA